MSRPCSVCSRSEAFQINEALVVEKTSNRRVAAQYHLSEQAVRRHREHIPKLLVEAAEIQGLEQAEDLLGSVRGLHARTVAVLNEAEDKQELKTALAAIREARGNLELLAKMRKVIDERPVINVYHHPEMISAQNLIVTALEGHPEAQQAVLRAIRARKAELEESNLGAS